MDENNWIHEQWHPIRINDEGLMQVYLLSPEGIHRTVYFFDMGIYDEERLIRIGGGDAR